MLAERRSRMKILIVAPPFFDYYKKIQNELIGQGHQVDHYDDRPSKRNLIKILGRINFTLIEPFVTRHFNRLISNVKRESYDQILFLGGMSFCFTRKQMDSLKLDSDSELILYLWDSLDNCTRVKNSLPVFDKVFSFDPKDAEAESIEFQPLFYSSEFAPDSQLATTGKEFDAVFVGSVHQSEKFLEVNRIVNQLRAKGLSVFTHYYMPSRLVTAMRRIQYPEYRRAILTNTVLSTQEIGRIYSASTAVIDSPQANQNGLTIRTLETLGSRKKLITTNATVQDYNFYNSSNILVWDLVDDNTIDEFFKTGYVDMDSRQYEQHNLTNWAMRLTEKVRTK